MSKSCTPFKSPTSWGAGLVAGICLLVLPVQGQVVPAAIAVVDNLDLNGNGMSTDSYDSSNPFLSNYGRYDPNHVEDTGDFVCNWTTSNSIFGGNASIYGHLRTGPNGTASIGNNGGVGTHAYQTANPGTFQPGYYSHDSHFVLPGTPLPYNSGLPPGAGTSVVTVTYNISSNYVGNSSTYPNPPPWSGVSTNITSWVTVPSVPDPVPSGLVTNSMATNSPSYPAAGTFFGNVSTNGSSPTNTSYYPAPGTYIGSVSTNTATVTSSNYPTPGSYVGSVSTNYTGISLRNQPTQPTPGTYVPGSLVHRGNGNWDYILITSTTYFYQVVIGYQYNLANGYSYNLITGYAYPIFTYNYANYATNAIYQTNYYDHVLSSGDYFSSTDLTGNTIVVGTARLVLPNGLNMVGSESITIANGGSLTAYVGGTTLTISGNSSGNISDGGVINMQGYPQNFMVFATPTITNLTVNGKGEFAGVLVAPDADATMNGGGNSDNDFMGSLVVNSVKMNGHFMFHFDESLARSPVWPVYASGAATLNAALFVGNSAFRFVVAGVPGFTYAVQASTDLVDWTTLGTNTSPFLFVDTDATNYSARLYRTVWVP